MSYRFHEHCQYCDTEYVVEFESEDGELMHCPSCGEEIPEFEEDEVYLDEDGEWEE